MDVLHALRDAVRLEALILPASPAGEPAELSPAAYVGYGTICSVAVREAGDLLAGLIKIAAPPGRVRDFDADVSVDPDTAD